MGFFVVLKRETHRHVEGDDITDPRRLMQVFFLKKEKLKPWTVGLFRFWNALCLIIIWPVYFFLLLFFFVKLNITRILSFEYRTSIETESLAWVWLTDLGEVAAVSCLLTLLYTHGGWSVFFFNMHSDLIWLIWIHYRLTYLWKTAVFCCTLLIHWKRCMPSKRNRMSFQH